MSMIIPRVGMGHDTHKLIPGNGFLLGGVHIPHTFSLHGHSDADVLLHAVTDALLGAAGMGDIGDFFPDDASENMGRDSAEMLKSVYAKVKESGWMIGNLDCIIFAQRPKLKELKSKIASRIAEILEISPSQVGIKAKTGEGVGIVGQEIVIQAQSVLLLVPSRQPMKPAQQTLVAKRALPVNGNMSPVVSTPLVGKVPSSPSAQYKPFFSEKEDL